MYDCRGDIAGALCGCLCCVSSLEVSWGYWSQLVWETVINLIA